MSMVQSIRNMCVAQCMLVLTVCHTVSSVYMQPQLYKGRVHWCELTLNVWLTRYRCSNECAARVLCDYVMQLPQEDLRGLQWVGRLLVCIYSSV